MSRVRVEIDLNSRDAQGLTRTRLKNASGRLHEGQIVTAFESEDEVQALATVARVDEATGYVFLDVDWESKCDDDGAEPVGPHAAASARAGATGKRRAAAPRSIR